MAKKYSEYKGVTKKASRTSSGQKDWVCCYKSQNYYYKTEKEAAKGYDLLRIRDGKAPVNILKAVK